MKLYKILDEKGRSCNGGNAQWKLPQKRDDGSWESGEWMDDISGELEPCENGYHICRDQDLLIWLGHSIFEVEYDGEMVECDEKIVVRRCRLIRKCENWNEKTARLFGCWCVRNTPLTDGRTVWDLIEDPSQKAVEIAERYAECAATEKELATAKDAARAAAKGAAWNAVWTAARDAAWNAVWDATKDAVWNAARAAAWAATKGAAWNAVWDAIWNAAWNAARAVQTKELVRILENG